MMCYSICCSYFTFTWNYTFEKAVKCGFFLIWELQKECKCITKYYEILFYTDFWLIFRRALLARSWLLRCINILTWSLFYMLLVWECQLRIRITWNFSLKEVRSSAVYLPLELFQLSLQCLMVFLLSRD